MTFTVAATANILYLRQGDARHSCTNKKTIPYFTGTLPKPLVLI